MKNILILLSLLLTIPAFSSELAKEQNILPIGHKLDCASADALMIQIPDIKNPSNLRVTFGFDPRGTSYDGEINSLDPMKMVASEILCPSLAS